MLNQDKLMDSWNYQTTEFKKDAVEETGLYECYDDYFIAYKGIRSDRYSAFNFHSAWTKEDAADYCNELVIKVKIYYKDVARVVHNGVKIQCSKFTVLD